MNKKAIAILGAIFLLIVGTLGFLIYSKYAGSKSPGPSASNNTASSSAASGLNLNPPASTTPPQTPPTGPVNLTTDQVVSPALFFNGLGLSYFNSQGSLFQASLDNSSGQLTLSNKKQLAIPLKSGIIKVLWPSKGNDFIAELPGAGGKIFWSYFNGNSAVYTDLPPQMTSVDWGPNGDKIFYVWFDGSKAVLATSDPDAKNYKKLSDLRENDYAISVSPDGLTILVYEAAGTSANNALASVSSDGKIWKVLVNNGYNSGVLWSPDSQKFLFGKIDPSTQKYQLWMDNLATGEIKNLGLYTGAQKAVWDKDSNIIYAAVPSSGTLGQNSLTVDSFYRLDTTSLDKKQYSSGLATPVDGRDLFLNATGDKLFFRNAQDGGLYYLDLTQ